MKLIGDQTEGESDGGDGRTIIVGVKLDSESRELLTWALVKVAEPGDRVIALHALVTFTEDAPSLLSLVQTFNSILSVYEGFCNLKQLHLKLKVCRGSSVRKILKGETKSYGPGTLIVGTSKSHRRIRSSASVAKYCSRKLSKNFSVLAVSNGKVVFKREATNNNAEQLLDIDDGKNSLGLANKSLDKRMEVLNDTNASGEAVKPNIDHHCVPKSCSCCWKNTLKRKCIYCSPVLPLLDSSVNEYSDNSLALVPIQTPSAVSGSHSSVARGSFQLKSRWRLLHQVLFSKRKHIQKPVKKTSVFECISRESSCHSLAAVYPDQKLTSSDQNQDNRSSLDGNDNAIVPFELSVICPPSPCKYRESLPKELLNLNDKYSSSCRVFTYQELSLATSNFRPDNMVGKGGSSFVYRGQLPDRNELAVKILKQSEDVIKEFVQEIEIITALHHKNIISLLGFCFEESHLLLVYDFHSRGSLEENLHGNKKELDFIGWQERFKIAVGVAEALDYLHNGCAEPVIHGDVKSSNILLPDDFDPKLADFGFASWASISSRITCKDVTGTFGYLAPEYFMHGKVSDKIDVYAFGVVLLELLSGRKPINREFPKDHESLVLWAKPILKERQVSELLDRRLGSDYNHDQIGRMILAATLCIRRSPRVRPRISLVLKLLQGDEEVMNWAKKQVYDLEELDTVVGESLPSNLQSHLNLALLDLEDDSISVSSGEQSISIEDYLRGRWSRTASFA